MTLADNRLLVLPVVLVALACHDGTSPTRHITPRELDAIGNPAQFAMRGDDALEPLRVRVIGTDEKPFPGARVIWTTEPGAAVIDPPASTTDVAGEAIAHVDELAVLGAVRITASVEKLPSVTFTINVADPCLNVDAHATRVDSLTIGALRVIDCRIGDQYFDFYAVVLSGQRALTLRATSPSFEPWLHAFDLSTGYELGSVGNESGNGSAALRIILSGGVNGMGVTSMAPLRTGPYTIVAESAAEDVPGCGLTLVAHDISTRQQLEGADCGGVSGAPYFDIFHIYLWAGQSVALSDSSTAFTPRMRLFSSGGTTLGDASGDGVQPARLALTAPADDYYTIVPSSVAAATGSYTLSVRETTNGRPELTARRSAAATRDWQPAPRALH